MFTTARTQIIIAGFIALAGPGLFNALMALGAAGGPNSVYANRANAAMFSSFALFSYLGGPLFSIFRNKVLVTFGALSYCLYVIGIYLALFVSGAGWVPILTGLFAGIGASSLWTCQIGMIKNYSTPLTRACHMGIFWLLFNFGGVLGGILQFGINFHNQERRASKASYFTFIAIMGLSAILAPFLLRDPSKVVKADGTSVKFEIQVSSRQQLRSSLESWADPAMFLLTIYFAASTWFYAYLFNYINGSLFNIRTRGFNSTMFWLSNMIGAYCISYILNSKLLTRRAQAALGWVCTTSLFLAAWIFGLWIQYSFEGGYDKDWQLVLDSSHELLDITHSTRNAVPIIGLIVFSLASSTMQSFSFWLLSALAGSDADKANGFATYYKTMQSIGAAIAWGIDLSPTIMYATQFWIGFALWAAGSASSYIAVRRVKNDVLSRNLIPGGGSIINSASEGAVTQMTKTD